MVPGGGKGPQATAQDASPAEVRAERLLRHAVQDVTRFGTDQAHSLIECGR